MLYYRPLVQLDSQADVVFPHALPLAGTCVRFAFVDVLQRNQPRYCMRADALPAEVQARLSEPRPTIAGLSFAQPKIMGILNVTPDSFSDGGVHNTLHQAVQHAQLMLQEGADLIDIGGESTRPGAHAIPVDQEIERVVPVIRALRTAKARAGGAGGSAGAGATPPVPISIDTRKADVAVAAHSAGATMVNDVSALQFDHTLGHVIADNNMPVCLVHARGIPATMQNNPHYNNVVLDVYDELAIAIQRAEQYGIVRSRIVIDPGIGFAKTQQHTIALLQNLSLFHGLGVPVLVGVSRKGFIGAIGAQPQASLRLPGSLAVGLHALA